MLAVCALALPAAAAEVERLSLVEQEQMEIVAGLFQVVGGAIRADQ